MRATISLRGLEAINQALESLVMSNLEELRSGIGRGTVLEHARYQREPVGAEQWKTRARVMQDGQGDCEDLAAALAAELRWIGVPAIAIARLSRSGVGYHAVVRVRGIDKELDPSRWLGM